MMPGFLLFSTLACISKDICLKMYQLKPHIYPHIPLQWDLFFTINSCLILVTALMMAKGICNYNRHPNTTLFTSGTKFHFRSIHAGQKNWISIMQNEKIHFHPNIFE